MLCGRLDRSVDDRIAWDELANPYEGTYALIVADHQPYDYDQLSHGVAQMQLSGHAHAGQPWPLQVTSNPIKMPWNGWYDGYSIPVYASAGMGGWMMPFRLERHCEWDLIQLPPKEEGSTESSEVAEIVAPAEPVEPMVPVDPVGPIGPREPTEAVLPARGPSQGGWAPLVESRAGRLQIPMGALKVTFRFSKGCGRYCVHA